MLIEGAENVKRYRQLLMAQGMVGGYLHGIRMTRKAPSCFTLAKRENSFKGNKLKIYAQFCTKYGLDADPRMVAKAP